MDLDRMFVFAKVIFKSVNFFMTRPKEDHQMGSNYLLKWLNILNPQQLVPFPDGPTITSHDIVGEVSTLLRLCLPRSNQSIELIRGFLSTVWKNRIFDYHPGNVVYADREGEFTSLVYDIVRLKANLLELTEFYKELRVDWTEKLESPSKFVKECEEFIGFIKNIYEAYRYIVGFVLALSNIEGNLHLPPISEYFDDGFNTGDGIKEFYKRKLRKIGARPLNEYLRGRFPVLHTLFVGVLYDYARIQRIYDSHKVLDRRQTKSRDQIYLIESKGKPFEFSWQELAQIFSNLYEIYKIFFWLSLKILPRKIRYGVFEELRFQEIQNPMTEELDRLLDDS